MEKVLSGIRPTGQLHLGNYFGAVKNMISYQNDYDCYLFVADLHALTTHPTSKNLSEFIKRILLEYIACGIDPEKCTIYLQSEVPEISQLFVILNMLASKTDLERTNSFKDKVRKDPKNINAGLLTYPVLMASDILIHRADLVPVGKDQVQHLEMARELAKKFNTTYDVDLFPDPKPLTMTSKPIIIPGLDGNKMGKSEGNAIYLGEDYDSIFEKINKIPTCSCPTDENQEMPDTVFRLFNLLKLFNEGQYSHFCKDWNSCKIDFKSMKIAIASSIYEITSSIRQRIISLDGNVDLRKILDEGREKARSSANETLKFVKQAVGLRLP